ncbi:kinesin-related protein [Cryptosporidium felis]|nr:kinesin-related protein [Cryptosporidium felis]
MSTPLERRINRKFQILEENTELNEKNKGISKAFGIPPRFNEALIMNTNEGKKLLVSANIPNESIKIHRDLRRNKRSDNRKKYIMKSDPFDEVSDISSSSSPSLTDDYKINTRVEKITSNSKKNDGSNDFASIFRSVNDDLKRLSMQVSDSSIEDKDSIVNLTSPEFASGIGGKGYPHLSNSNTVKFEKMYSSEDIPQKNNESIDFTQSLDSSVGLSSDSRYSFSNQNSEKNESNKNENSAIINKLIQKLTFSISKLKKMVIGKDNFVNILRDQMQKSNHEIISLSQKVDLLQKELASAKRGKEKYKDSMKKLLNDIQDGKVDGTIHNYILQIEAMKIQNERNITNINNNELTIIQLQSEKEKLLVEKNELNNKISNLEEKVHKLNLVVNQVTDEKLELLESKESASREMGKLLENIKSCNDENRMSLEELKRGYELNNVLQDHVMLLKAQLEITTEEKVSQEKITSDLKDEIDIIKQKLKSFEHRESILLSALEDSSYKMTDIDKALEEQRLEYEAIIKKENERYNEIYRTYNKQSEELEILKFNLKEKTDQEQEQIRMNEELKRKFGSFENHIRRLLDARDNEIIQLNDYMDGKLRKKDEETNQKIQEMCKIQQERERRLINQMLDQHDGFERKRIEYEHEIDSIRNSFTEKLDKTVKLESEKQLRLAETLVNKEHEIMIKENIIQEIDKKNVLIEQQLSETKSNLNEIIKEKNETIEKLLSLEQWGVLINTVNQMNPELQDSLNTRLNELRSRVEHLEKQEDKLNHTINNHSSVQEGRKETMQFAFNGSLN